jgi:hypothetical protein
VKRAIYKGKQVAVKFIEGIEDDSDLYIMFRKELEILLYVYALSSIETLTYGSLSSEL